MISRGAKNLALQYICCISKKDPFLTASEVATNCNILQKCLYVLSANTFAMVDFSEEEHRANHFYRCNIFETEKWCWAYLKRNPEKWKTFIFSNESRFLTYANITRLVRRPRSKRYSRKYVVQTIKYGGSSIIV